MPRKSRRLLAGRWAQIEQERREQALIALAEELRRARCAEHARGACSPTPAHTDRYVRRHMN